MIKADALRVWVVLLLSLGMTGCGTTSPAVTFYALSPVSIQSAVASPTQAAPTIGVGPVTLPDYLDRPQLITRTGPNQMKIDEYHRWAGALEQEIVRVITQNLITLLGSDRVAPIPWPGDFSPDITVRLEVYAFEAASDATARLRATVTLGNPRSGAMPVTWTVDLEEQAENSAYEALVAAQSRLLAQLSRQIAGKIGNRSE